MLYYTSILLLLISAIFIIRKWTQSKTKTLKEPKKNIKTLIVLGSGGHTSEMLTLVSALPKERYTPRIYLAAKSDPLSLERASNQDPDGHIEVIPRSRKVGQSFLSSFFSTLWSFFFSYQVFIRVRPDLILCNGPGTCVPICLAAWITRILTLSQCRTKVIYVESFCRVNTLSLSGRILSFFIDEVLVQWPELALKYPRTRYVDRFL